MTPTRATPSTARPVGAAASAAGQAVGEPAPLTVAVVALMRGVVYAESNEPVWQHIRRLQPQIADHVEVMGLMLVIDEAEGYAYLRSRPDDPDAPIPRLVPRHRLSFPVSLLLALLRKAVAEFDATSGEGQLVVTRDRLVDEVRTFLADSPNEARIVDQIDQSITKAVELGFLRAVPASGGWQVRRIIKAFIDAQWLHEFDARLREYAASAGVPESAAAETGTPGVATTGVAATDAGSASPEREA